MKNIVLIISLLSVSILNAQNINGSFESKFKRYQKNESFVGVQTQNWTTVAWQGDRIYKQLLLWSDSSINGLSYTVSNLVKGGDQIAASNMQLRFGQYVKGDPEPKSCAEYPTHPTAVEIIDALTDVEVTSLTDTDPLKMWLTIDVPNTSATGVYTGTVTINGGATPLVFNISLNVVNYALPDVADWSFHLDLWQFPVNILDHYNTSNPASPITIWSDEHFALFELGYKILADMGQSAIATQIKGDALGMPSMIKWTKKTNGTWEYDFTAFDKYVTTLMSWGITKQIDCFSPVGWNEDTIPYWDEATNAMLNLSATIGSTTYNMRWDHFLTAFKTFLDSKGWFDKAVLYLDEVEQSKLNDVFAMVQSNNSTWKIGIAHTSALSTSNSSQLYDASGILGTTSTTGRTEKITTFYTSCSQVKPNSYVTPETSLAEVTWMGWHATRENLNGYLRWAYDNWKSTDPFDIRDGSHTAGDFSMVYRNSNNSPLKYLPSLRGIMLRDGIQDFEKLKILKTSLESSSDPYDQEILAALNVQINKFGNTSGGIAESLVIAGQKAIEDIVLGTFSYCKVNGGGNTDHYVKSLTTTGGTENISFSTNQFPNTGYEHHTTSKVSATHGESITLNLENSTASNCARTKVWIDWNNDDDFDDSGEEIFSGGTQGACSNALSYSIPITIPANVDQGIKRVRIQVRESNESEPQACGALEKSGTVDFDLEVLIVDTYCEVEGEGFLDYYVVGLTTTGGTDSNINFSGNGFPLNGYEYHSDSKINVETGDDFELNLENSTNSNCARTKIWIDWNNDDDFDDTGEIVYNGDIFQSCENTTSKVINIAVPINASIGKTRMRVRLRDAWLEEPTSCGTFNHTGAADFDINIAKKPFNLQNDNFTIQTLSETCPGQNNGKIHITSQEAHDFKITIDGNVHSFTSDLWINDLEPKNHTFCITTPEETDFKQCFEIEIDAAPVLSGKMTVSSKSVKEADIKIEMFSGSPPFTILVNQNIVAKTLKSTYTVHNVNQGDQIGVIADATCQGKMTQEVLFNNRIIAYPNPTQKDIEVFLPNIEKSMITVSIFNMQNQLISRKDLKTDSGMLKVSFNGLSKGLYMLKLKSASEKINENIKVVRK